MDSRKALMIAGVGGGVVALAVLRNASGGGGANDWNNATGGFRKLVAKKPTAFSYLVVELFWKEIAKQIDRYTLPEALQTLIAHDPSWHGKAETALRQGLMKVQEAIIDRTVGTTLEPRGDWPIYWFLPDGNLKQNEIDLFWSAIKDTADALNAQGVYMSESSWAGWLSRASDAAGKAAEVVADKAASAAGWAGKFVGKAAGGVGAGLFSAFLKDPVTIAATGVGAFLVYKIVRGRGFQAGGQRLLPAPR